MNFKADKDKGKVHDREGSRAGISTLICGLAAVDSALSVSRVGSSGQFIYFKRLVGTIKNDLTNYRQYVDSSQISDVESDDILLLKLKGIAIECIY